MPIPAELQSAHEIVAFTIGLIAFMQAVAWVRHREPGMLWFAIASLLTTVLFVRGSLALPRGVDPSRDALLVMYVVRALFAYGLTDYLVLTPRRRAWLVAALLLPELAFAAVLVVGGAPVTPAAAAPLMWANLGLALACAVATRRDSAPARLLLAAAPLIGPVSVAIDAWTPGGVRAGFNFTLAAIGFGVIVLVVGLMRKTRESRLAHAHAQRMSNYYAALSHTGQALLRIKEPVALYREICRICVESAQAKMACVYAADGDFAHRIASAGGAATILAGYPDPWDMRTSQARESLLVQAILDGRPRVSNDYLGDASAERWRGLAREHGLRAIAVMPLRRGGRPVAALMVCAGEAGTFDAALVQLLGEMTGDISFALDNIDREQRHLASVREVEAGLERFERLFQSAPIASAILSVQDRRVLDVNDAMCALQKAHRDDIVGRTTESLGMHALREDRERFFETLRSEGRVRNMVLRMADDDGNQMLELTNAEPIEYMGRPCVIYTSLDITDMRAAEEARRALLSAQAASHAKTTFLSRMSHELRTPLNAVIGFSGLLRQEAAERLAPQQLEQLDHVQLAGWHLLRLIDDVLDLARIESGQYGTTPARIELAPLLDEALRMIAPRADDSDITLDAGYRDAPAAWVTADATRLRQVVLNLLSNAVKYNRRGGGVRIDIAPREHAVEIAVTDTGLGMDDDQLAHLFEPFNRLGREREGFEGTGIGLALTRQLMHLMDGDVAVTSEAGRGTCVLLTLPVAEAPGDTPETPPTAAVPAHAPGQAPSGTVLYIEDSQVNTLLVQQLLARWPGVRLLVAADGLGGLHMAQAELPDLVLLDLQLPDIAGLEVLERLRQDAALGEVPIVVLSANAMPQDVAEARRRGATDYWTKPLDFPKFLAGVADLLPSAREVEPLRT